MKSWVPNEKNIHLLIAHYRYHYHCREGKLFLIMKAIINKKTTESHIFFGKNFVKSTYKTIFQFTN